MVQTTTNCKCKIHLRPLAGSDQNLYVPACTYMCTMYVYVNACLHIITDGTATAFQTHSLCIASNLHAPQVEPVPRVQLSGPTAHAHICTCTCMCISTQMQMHMHKNTEYEYEICNSWSVLFSKTKCHARHAQI